MNESYLKSTKLNLLSSENLCKDQRTSGDIMNKNKTAQFLFIITLQPTYGKNKM